MSKDKIAKLKNFINEYKALCVKYNLCIDSISFDGVNDLFINELSDYDYTSDLNPFPLYLSYFTEAIIENSEGTGFGEDFEELVRTNAI